MWMDAEWNEKSFIDFLTITKKTFIWWILNFHKNLIILRNNEFLFTWLKLIQYSITYELTPGTFLFLATRSVTVGISFSRTHKDLAAWVLNPISNMLIMVGTDKLDVASPPIWCSHFTNSSAILKKMNRTTKFSSCLLN